MPPVRTGLYTAAYISDAKTGLNLHIFPDISLGDVVLLTIVDFANG